MKEKKNRIKKDLFNGIVCKEGNRQTAGITLIALIITIIILLILAGITISQLAGNEIFDKAKLAKKVYENKQEEENDILSSYENTIELYGSRDDIIENISSGEFIGRYQTSSTVKNNKTASITINDLTVGENYFMVILRCATSGTNGVISAPSMSATTFSNMTYTQLGDTCVYNFTPTNTSITITFGSNSDNTSCGGHSYAFLFKGSLQEPTSAE